MTVSDSKAASRREQIQALVQVGKNRPNFNAVIGGTGVFGVALEAVGLSFILPIVEIVRSPSDPADKADSVLGVFVAAYQALCIPFTLGSVVDGVSQVSTGRRVLTFVVRWLREVLVFNGTRELQIRSVDNVRIKYFGQEGWTTF